MYTCETRSTTLALARLCFAQATARLRGERWGYCYVVPMRRGFDAERGAWRRAMVFGDASLGAPPSDVCDVEAVPRRRVAVQAPEILNEAVVA